MSIIFDLANDPFCSEAKNDEVNEKWKELAKQNIGEDESKK